MDQLMTEILKIDEIAQKKIVDAKNENRKILKSLPQKKQEIINNIRKEADLNVKKFEKCEIEAFKEKILILEKKQRQILEGLKKTYDENHKNWIHSIVSNALSD